MVNRNNPYLIGGGYVSLKPVEVKPLLAFATDRPCKDVAAFGRPRHRDGQVLHVWMTVSAQSLAIYVNFEVHGHSISRGHAKENRACMICGMMQ